jgi:uroporphyrinogen-III decarboxylase
MGQTPREIVQKALTFEEPERVPRQLWALPWAEGHYPEQLEAIRQKYPADIVTAPNVNHQSTRVKGDPFEIGQYTDEWGCLFENKQAGIIGEVKDPTIKNIADLSDLKPPYETLPTDIDQARDIVNEFCEKTDKFVLAGCLPRPWERMQFLRGTADSMMDILADADNARTLIGKIHEFYMKELEFWVSTNVDAIFFMDDWGSQTNLLIPPATWQEFFKPLYKDYCDLAHANGKFAFMHSDGCISEIYPHLIEVGVDAINSQIFCMDMDELAKTAKGKITFWGEIDRQHILPSDDINEVRNAVAKVVDKLYDHSGGIIAQLEFGPGTRPENVNAVFEEWDKVQGKG